MRVPFFKIILTNRLSLQTAALSLGSEIRTLLIVMTSPNLLQAREISEFVNSFGRKLKKTSVGRSIGMKGYANLLLTKILTCLQSFSTGMVEVN